MQNNQMSKKSNDGKRPRGKPRKYSDVKLFQKKIDEYFEMCEKKGIDPVITELALHLGFYGRQELLDYEERPEYTDCVKRAKAMVESAYVRKALGGKVNPAGPIFLLKQPPFNYRDIQDLNVGGPGGEPLELGNLELAARILSILALGRQRRETKQLTEKVENPENHTPAKSHE